MRSSFLLIVSVGLLVSCGGDAKNSPKDLQQTGDLSAGDVSKQDGAASDLGGQDLGPKDGGAVLDTKTDAGAADLGPIEEPTSSEYFLNYAKPEAIPGRFPASACDALSTHQLCVSTQGCNWMRTIKDNGVCRRDPVWRCVMDDSCVCEASNFHGKKEHDEDLEIFIPLSILWNNLAPSTSAFGGATERYETEIDIEEIVNESSANYTSRTDFSHKTLTVRAKSAQDLTGLESTSALSLTLKFMHVWDKEPAKMGGILFEGLGVVATLSDDQLTFTVDGQSTAVAVMGEHPTTMGVKDYQCNQLALIVPEQGDAVAHLGPVQTPIEGLTMAKVKAALAAQADPLQVLRLGAVNAKVWDLRLYTNGRQLSDEELAQIGRRCGAMGDYAIPEGYPESNERYSWGMGGYKIIPNHAQQHFSSGVYVTLWIPEPDAFPPVDDSYRDNLKRMIGFWDRWHEQMFFELDMIPFVDTRDLEPQGSLNSYRRYLEPLCTDETGCGERQNYNNPCRYVTDLFQAFNWLPEDFPDEPTSADHRKIAEAGGWIRWTGHQPDLYESWQRPVHEHGHTAHFTLMRTYYKVHHYIRGIAGESFAEIMAYYVLSGVKSWMSQGLLYYPTIPLAFEGRWDQGLEKHVFKSSQPYQEKNIDDQGLGARFYGLGVWWSFVSYYAAKPYLIGRLSGDTDITPGTTLQKTRFYLAQEGLDLGDLYANFAAHTATWDWPHIGHHYHQQEQDPFQGVGIWCTQNSGPDCTIDGLKIQADVSAEQGTNGAWVDSPVGRDPGGFSHSTVRIKDAPAGALYEISLDFAVPEKLYPGTYYEIGLASYCRNDPRFFSSRIVVADAGSEGQEDRPRRPEYYKIPGRSVDKVVVQVPEGGAANLYILAIPTPPFELEDVSSFVDGYSLTWPYRYKITRLDQQSEDTLPLEPIVLQGDQMLELDQHEGNGFVYDCFANQAALERR